MHREGTSSDKVFGGNSVVSNDWEGREDLRRAGVPSMFASAVAVWDALCF